MWREELFRSQNTDGSIDRDHWDAYVHSVSEWKIGLYEDGIDYYAPYKCYKYGVDNHSTKAGKRRPGRSQPLISGTVKSLEAIDGDTATSVGKGEKRKRKALASRVPTVINPAPKKIKMGASRRGIAGDKPLGFQAIPPSLIAILPSPAANVVTLVDDYTSRDEDRAVVESSPAYMRQIDFVGEKDVLEV